jgi:hypothetical protein
MNSTNYPKAHLRSMIKNFKCELSKGGCFSLAILGFLSKVRIRGILSLTSNVLTWPCEIGQGVEDYQGVVLLLGYRTRLNKKTKAD